MILNYPGANYIDVNVSVNVCLLALRQIGDLYRVYPASRLMVAGIVYLYTLRGISRRAWMYILTD